MCIARSKMQLLAALRRGVTCNLLTCRAPCACNLPPQKPARLFCTAEDINMLAQHVQGSVVSKTPTDRQACTSCLLRGTAASAHLSAPLLHQSLARTHLFQTSCFAACCLTSCMRHVLSRSLLVRCSTGSRRRGKQQHPLVASWAAADHKLDERHDAAPHLQLCQLLLQLPRNDLRVPRSESVLVVCRVGWWWREGQQDMCRRTLRETVGAVTVRAGYTTPLLPPASPGHL